MRADALTFDADRVERAAPGLAPTAFRIWKAGDNPTDHGDTRFTPRSARLLMAEQAQRKNLYAIDVDHKTLSKDAPPEARRAVGWHRLEVREGDQGPELWAVDLEWTQLARSAIEAQPVPEWRFFSPAYNVDPDTGEVISYLNTSITVNPATWDNTALASRSVDLIPSACQTSGDMSDQVQGSPVLASMKDVVDALRKMLGDDADKHDVAHAKRMLKAYEGRDAADDDGDADDADAKKAAADEGDEAPPSSEKPKPPQKDEDAKKMSADSLMQLASRVQALEAENQEMRTREERRTLLASRPDLAKDVRDWLEKADLETVRQACSILPRQKSPETIAAAVTPPATRGSDDKASLAERAPRLSPEENQTLRERMGLARRKASITREGNHQIFGVMTPDEAKAHLASRGVK